MDKFSGKSGEDDFDAWLEDFVEATNNMGWTETNSEPIDSPGL